MAIVTWTFICGSAVLGGAIYIMFCVVKLVYQIRARDRVLEQFPSDPRHWLYGHIFQSPGYNDAGLAFLRKQAAQYTKYSSLWNTCFNGMLRLHHPDTVKDVLMRADRKPEDGPYKFMRPMLGNGLVLSNGTKWIRNRKLLTHAFHFNVLRAYVPVTNESCEILLKKMGEYASSGTEMPLYINMSLCTLDTILRCAFSYDNDVQTRGVDHPFMKALSDAHEIWWQQVHTVLGYTPFYQWTERGRTGLSRCKYVRDIASGVISNRKHSLHTEEENKSKYRDFLDMLLLAKDEAGQGLTELEILDEVTTFMLAGHDTTASAISWTLYQLSLNPDHQELCRQEVDTILEGRDSDEILWSDISQLTYLTMCIKEVMRLHTVVPFLHRELTKDMVIDGKEVPRGTIVNVTMYMLHHNPTVWEHPMEFRPDRFSAANTLNRDPFAYVPFAAGPRNCIGQNFAMNEQKVTIARILRRFRISVDPDHTLETQVGITIQPKDSLKIHITPRTDI